jgi:hypothetical protein
VVYVTFTAISAPKNKIKIKTISLRACAREKKEFFMIKKGDKTKGFGAVRARHVRLACKVALQHVRKRHSFPRKLCAHFMLNYTQLQFARLIDKASKAIISRKITRNFTEKSTLSVLFRGRRFYRR